MSNPFNEKLSKLMDSGAVNELKKNSRAAATAVLNNLDAVSREEFDGFCEVLMRLSKRVEEMEERITRLEAAPAAQAAPAAAEQSAPAAAEQSAPPADEPKATSGLQLKKE
ncbi:MAG: accessory factor UbiK family protein [Gammaproteobacteria bacterium WSBS_2016_MAG_OTU1]